MRTSLKFWAGLLCIGAFIILLIQHFTSQYILVRKDSISSCCQTDDPLWNQTLDFEQLKFGNETGNPSGCYIVPNYIHYLYFGSDPIDYVQMICILAAFKNQNPDKIFFHFDNKATFTGKYWKILEQTPGLMNIIEFRDIKLPDKVFGQPLSDKWRRWHGSDIMRIKTIMKYGGIFLDNDCYIVKNIKDFRKYEVSVNWDENQFLGNQVIVAHKDARFLRRWLDTYKVYDGTKWYYNGGERPTVEVLYKYPELIHRVKVLFGADTRHLMYMFAQQWADWKERYIVHLFVRHVHELQNLSKIAIYPVVFNERNIAYYPVTFREMAYELYEVANIKWPKERYDLSGNKIKNQ